MRPKVVKPTWTSSSFLLYAGGLTVLGGALAALGYLSGQYGSAAYAGWAALILVVLYAIAKAFKRRDRWIAAGIFAFASVIAWAAFIAALWTWFGWLHGISGSPFAGFSVARLSLLLLVLLAAWDDRKRFNFPFISAITVVVWWLFVTDLISNGGNWTAVVTLLVGLSYFLAGSASDKPTAFWLHLAAGALVGGALVHWWHTTDTDWALISASALVFVGVAYATKRSTWAVFGALGFLGATLHYLFGQTSTGPLGFSVPSISGWSPSVAFACLGFWLVLLGLASRRRTA
jgi:hypothetical protein